MLGGKKDDKSSETKPSHPNSTKNSASSSVSPIFPFDLNSLLPFHSDWSQGPCIPPYSLLPFHPSFYDAGQRLHPGLTACGDDREKGGQVCVMISRQAMGSACLSLKPSLCAPGNLRGSREQDV